MDFNGTAAAGAHSVGQRVVFLLINIIEHSVNCSLLYKFSLFHNLKMKRVVCSVMYSPLTHWQLFLLCKNLNAQEGRTFFLSIVQSRFLGNSVFSFQSVKSISSNLFGDARPLPNFVVVVAR